MSRCVHGVDGPCVACRRPEGGSLVEADARVRLAMRRGDPGEILDACEGALSLTRECLVCGGDSAARAGCPAQDACTFDRHIGSVRDALVWVVGNGHVPQRDSVSLTNSMDQIHGYRCIECATVWKESSGWHQNPATAAIRAFHEAHDNAGPRIANMARMMTGPDHALDVKLYIDALWLTFRESWARWLIFFGHWRVTASYPWHGHGGALGTANGWRVRVSTREVVPGTGFPRLPEVVL